LPIALSYSPFHSPSANSAELALDSSIDRKQELLEIGPKPKASAAALTSSLKVVSYNIRWRSGDDLHKLAQLLKEDPEIGSAAILGLQEVDRNKKRSGNKNSAEILARELGMYYAWAAPPAPKAEKEEETGVAILSAYPLMDVRRLVLPHKGPGGRRRAALGATIKLGRIATRVYSVHSETRIPIDCKLEQMKAVINDLARYDKNMPAIILGDLNTWEPDAVTKTFELFATAGFHTPFDEQPTFFRRALFIPIDLKLDWIWLRNLEATSNGIDRTIKLSDHFPLWITLRTPEGKVDSPVIESVKR
jgi:endonuclease/exonuclease/phosphatase family metal-dependent hydrolase